ncbi:hypothetical protein [Endozoicomonas lisbonensis]|uniref:Transposase n=1 Tax=Endozoicomonas lisbonensis TaxID=3120522 RepID=A0ABV2SNT8_9GAMM
MSDSCYGGDDGFVDVLRLVEQGGQALPDHFMLHLFSSRISAPDKK